MSEGEFIGIRQLNDFQLVGETKREWLFPLETKRLVRVIDFLKELVNDKIIIKDDDEINYEF